MDSVIIMPYQSVIQINETLSSVKFGVSICVFALGILIGHVIIKHFSK